LDNLWRRRPLGLEAELEMVDDLIDNLRPFDKRYTSQLATTGRAQQRVHFIDLADHLGPAFGGHIVWLIFNERGREGSPLLPYVP